MRLDGCICIFCIAEYRGTQDMYSLVTCIFGYVYIYARGCTFYCDIGLVVRTWMRFMMFDVFVLHMDASSLGCWARGFPLRILCDAV